MILTKDFQITIDFIPVVGGLSTGFLSGIENKHIEKLRR